MDNKKIYTIQINGIKESVNAVDSLNKQLDELEGRIKSLESRTVKVGTVGGSGGTSKTLSQQTSAEKEINKLKEEGIKLDAKIAAAQTEVYQNVLATKDVYKEVLADQKSIAAQERLTANAYSNTMQGMKQKLSDLKSVINTTDLGDSDGIKKMTQEANELTNKLKEMEEAYGQFGRNVGNYKSAAEGFSKYKIEVGGVVREFNTAKEAARTLSNELLNLPKGAKGAKELRAALQQVKSEIQDIGKSSATMDNLLDTMESFTAMGQIANGFSAFFGFDNDEIQRSIQKLVALQNVMQGIEKINKQLNSQEGIGKLFKGGSEAVDTFVAKITGAEMGVDGLTKGSKLATVAVRGLSVALKGLGIGLAMFVVTKVIDGISNITKEMNTAEKQTNRLDEALNTLKKDFENKNEILSSSYLKNEISDEQFLTTLYQNQSKYLNEQINLLQQRAELMQKQTEGGGFWSLDFMSPFTRGASFTGEKMDSQKTVESYSWLSDLQPQLKITVNNVKELEEEWKKCNEAVKGGEDYFTKWGKGFKDFLNSLFTTVSDTERVMHGLGNLDLSNLIGNFAEVNDKFNKGKISAEEYAKELEKLVKELNNSDVLKGVIANLDTYIPDEKVRTAVNNIINDIIRLNDAFNMASPSQVHFWEQVRIDGMKEGWAKTKAQLDADEKYEIQSVAKTEKQKDLIHKKYERKRQEERKKYNKQETDKAKQHSKELETVEHELQSVLIENMPEGLQKQLALLEEERRQRLAKAKENGISVGKITEEINKLYDKKILDAKEEWAERVEQVYIDMWSKIYQINHQNAQMNYDNELKDLELKYAKLKDLAAKNSSGVNFDYSDRDIKVSQNEKGKYKVSVEKESEYTKRLGEEFKKRTEQRKKYNKDVETLTKQEIEEKYSNADISAQEMLNNELTTLKNGYKAQDRELKDNLKKGLITKKQYKEASERLEQERAEQEAQIQITYANKAVEREREKNNEMFESTQRTNEETLSNYKQFFDKLKKINTSVPIFNKFGLINIKEVKKRNDRVVNLYQQLSNDITNEITALESKLKNEDITKEQREQIEALINELKKLGIQIKILQRQASEDSKGLWHFNFQEINKYIQEFGQSLQSLLSTIWDSQDAAYDKMVEELDKSIDAVKEKYDKMDALAEEHKNNMESIEDQIAGAQGDAREHLLQRYNAEIEAQRAINREKKKAQKEEEKLEKKKAKMEEEQRKKEHERAVAQAIISAALATVNGYATQPFVPVGLIMGSMAAALGAAQVAIIKNQKYAEGGVLQGKSHAQGGIKVLGGQAEVEGGEYITNKVTTAKNVDLLEYINTKKRRVNLDDLIEFYGGNSSVKKNIQGVRTKFADGGQIPMLSNNIELNNGLAQAMQEYANRQSVVSVVDIIDKVQKVNTVKVMAGLPSSNI